MEEYQEDNHISQEENRNRWAEMQSQVNRPLLAAVVALFVILVITAAYGLHQQAMVKQLTAQSAASTQSVAQLQNQVNALTSQIQGMNQASQAQTAAPQPTEAANAPETESTPPPALAAETPATAAPAAKPAPARHHAVKHHAKVDKRYEQMQAQLNAQQKELSDTQAQVEKYRSDLEGSINSTRDELSGSIAKNHDELVALEKRGERNFYEFDLSKSKQFERVGPLSLSLRKADTKHKSYDLSMIVDDNQLTKKKVNLYEPVVIHTENDGQPVEIVVNRIEKNVVHGYVSTAKYKPSELAAAGAATATVTPVSATVPSASNATSGAQRPQ